MSRVTAEHQGAGGIHAHRAACRMDAEQLGRGPAVSMGLGAVLVEEAQRVCPDRRPLGRREISAGRGVLGRALDLVAPGGHGGREVSPTGGLGAAG